MKHFIHLSFLLSCFLVLLTHSQETPIRYDFNKSTAAENGITLQGPDFGALPLAEINFGTIPKDNAFDGATDGKGMVIQADAGEGIMIFTPPIQTNNCALIRCSIRSSAAHVSVYLASLDQGNHQFVSTITPSNGSFFLNRYRRVADLFLPPSTGFQGIIQIVNTSPSLPVTVYLDNWEILIKDSESINLNLTDLMGDSTDTTITIPLALPTGAKSLKMVLIKAGSFAMGSPSNERSRDSEETQHQVTLTKDFYLGKYEVTQAQWKAVMGTSPSYFKGDNRPVEQVSWNDCQIFIQKLNQMNQGTFRLPSEAEWEYACRAGTTTRFSFGDALECADSGEVYCDIMDKYMWWGGNNTYNRNVFGTKEVGLKLPNSWGLFDMHGNVWEWCQDWYGTYSNIAQTDPLGANYGFDRVIRGGYWNYSAMDCRSAVRYLDNPNDAYLSLGFRISKTP